MTDVNELVTERQKAWHQAKDILDRCVAEKRERSAEENEMYERAAGDVDRLGKQINDLVNMRETEQDIATVRAALEPLIAPRTESEMRSPGADGIESWFRAHAGDDRTAKRSFDIDLSAGREIARAVRAGASENEIRALYSDTGTSGTLIPTTFVRELYAYMEETSAVRQIARVFSTTGGETLEFPSVLAHGQGTQVIAQGTAIGGTDPTFTEMTLGAYKFGQLVGVSRELLSDSGVDILGFLAQDLGYAVGRTVAPNYVTGAGSTGPKGVMVAAGTGVKTGGTLVTVDFDDLIDLQHSVASPYRPSAVWLMNDSTAAQIRKLRAGAGDAAGTVLGEYLWQPSVVAGQPDRLLGHPVYTDFSVAAQGSAARAVAFGDFSTFYVRDAGQMRVERSDDYGFNTDTVYFRAVMRTDSDLRDSNAIKTSAQQA